MLVRLFHKSFSCSKTAFHTHDGVTPAALLRVRALTTGAAVHTLSARAHQMIISCRTKFERTSRKSNTLTVPDICILLCPGTTQIQRRAPTKQKKLRSTTGTQVVGRRFDTLLRAPPPSPPPVRPTFRYCGQNLSIDTASNGKRSGSPEERFSPERFCWTCGNGSRQNGNYSTTSVLHVSICMTKCCTFARLWKNKTKQQPLGVVLPRGAATTYGVPVDHDDNERREHLPPTVISLFR